MQYSLRTFKSKITRLGVALEPEGEFEEEGVLNPASAIDREGNLLLYPRCVARGNVSRVGIVKVTEHKGVRHYERLGFALEPEAEYELHGKVGQGCEDPRVTFVSALDLYLMAYTAYGAPGPRAAMAYSRDGYRWERLGVVQFPKELNLHADDKDVAFFPEPVQSPSGVLSIAFYHRPMVDIPPSGDMDSIQTVLNAPPAERQSIRIAYVPLSAVRQNLQNLTQVAESALVLSPGDFWGQIKLGAGSPPVRIKEGWLSIYHGVDAFERQPGNYAMRYSAGIVIHDAERPDRIVYCSNLVPVLVPETAEELMGTVNNVVFPTALLPREDIAPRTFDGYYGMADFRIGWFRLKLGKERAARRSTSGRRRRKGTGRQLDASG